MPAPFVFDAHVDTLQLALEMGVDLTQSSPGQLDLPRAREGGLGAVVMTSWVNPKYLQPARGGARARAEALMDALHDLAERSSEQTRLIRTRRDWAAARGSGHLALIAGMEGAHPLEDRLEGLEAFFERGLRVLTLVWNNHLSWIRSCQDGAGPGVPEGLSALGQRFVEHANELGVLVDLSHCSERAFYETLETSSKPVIASHSGCASLQAHVRNLSDEQLRALAQNGGVVGVPFLPSFLDAGAQEQAADRRAGEGYRALSGESDAELEIARTRYMRGVLPPLGIDRLVDHIEHIAEVAGIDHVGIGSDFDGITTTVEGLEDAAGYPSLIEPLRSRGFSETDIASVLGGNMERVFVEALPD